MVRYLKCPITGKVLYLRKYADTGRYYLSTLKRSDEDDFDVTYDMHEAPTYDAHGNVTQWVSKK